MGCRSDLISLNSKYKRDYIFILWCQCDMVRSLKKKDRDPKSQMIKNGQKQLQPAADKPRVETAN